MGYVLCCPDCNIISEIGWDNENFTCPICGSVWEFESEDDADSALYSWCTERLEIGEKCQLKA